MTIQILDLPAAPTDGPSPLDPIPSAATHPGHLADSADDAADVDVEEAVEQCDGCAQPAPQGSPCENCAACDRCEETVPLTGVVSTARGSTICRTCAQRWYWRCEQCEEWNRDGADCGNGCHCEGCYCEDCSDDDGDFGGLVHDYEYKPYPVFHGTGTLFLGPEIEVATGDGGGWNCADIAVGHLGELGYLKEDGSIGDGFEIVTHPMSYDWAIEHFPWRMLTELADAGCYTPESVGIHVHLSRTGFSSQGHIYRWMKFIYRNETQVCTVARRRSEQWAAFTDEDRRNVKQYAKGERGDRYRAINTGNRDTFELRVFASSLQPAQVQAALGLAAASVEYTRGLRAVDILRRDGWTWAAFVDWLDDRPAYQPLRTELEALACVC